MAGKLTATIEMSSAEKQFDELPPSARMIGMWLFLAALTMLFLAAMLGYVLIRLNSTNRPTADAIHIPWSFALSTLAIIASSFTLEKAVRYAKANRIKATQTCLQITLVLTLLFIGIQTPGMLGLLSTHQLSPEQGNTLYGLVFVLILLHALHVLGGLVALIITIVRTDEAGSSTGDVTPLRSLAIYFHFLDGVWIIMLLIFVIMG